MTVRIVILAMVAAACAQSQVRAVNPINNSAATPHQVFTFQAASSDGSAVSEVYMRFGWQPWYGADQCSMAYIPSAGTFYLMNDSGTTWTGGLPVGSGTIQNGQCTLNLANTSVSGAMNNLTINADLTFDPTLKGSVGVYFAMTDGAAGDAGWYPLGSWLAWNLVSTAAPSVSFLASTTSGGATTFTYDFSDVNGYKYIYNNYALINPSLVANNSCEFSMFPGSNQIYLLSDSGGAWSSPETLGDSSQGALANSQCSLNVAQSSTTRNGNLVEVHLVVTLMSTAAEMNYAAPFDEVFSTPGWQAGPATFTSFTPASISVLPGGSGSISETFQTYGGFNSPVQLTLSVAPAGQGVSVPATVTLPVTGGSIPVTVASNAVPGYYTVTITAPNGIVSTVTVGVPGFTVTSSGQTVNVIQGKANLAGLTVTPLGGYASPITLTATTNSNGLSATAQSPITPGSSGTGINATVSLAASLTATTGTTSVTVTANGSFTPATVVPISVVAAQPDFVVSNPSINLTVTNGSPSTFTETITPIDGYSGAISMVPAYAVGNVADPNWSLCGSRVSLSNIGYTNNVLTIQVRSSLFAPSAPSPCPVFAALVATGLPANAPTKYVTLNITTIDTGSGYDLQSSLATVHVGAGSTAGATASMTTHGGYTPPVVSVTATASDPGVQANFDTNNLPQPSGDYSTGETVSSGAGQSSGSYNVALNGSPTANYVCTSLTCSHKVAVHPATSVTMAEYDNARTGANTNEYTLTPRNVGTRQFGLRWTYPVDGCVWAHPLYVAKYPDTMHGINSQYNVVYIATAMNTIYAFDADSSRELWHYQFGTPPMVSAPRGHPLGKYENLHSCPVAGNLDPSALPTVVPLGIMGTPVIDIQNSLMYFVTQVVDGTGTYQYQFHAMLLSSPVDLFPAKTLAASVGCPAPANLPAWPPYGFCAQNQMQRPALLLTSSQVLVAFGSYADELYDFWAGWLFSFRRNSTEQTGATAFLRTDTTSLFGNGIWMSGGGIAYDDVRDKAYFATANDTVGYSLNKETGKDNGFRDIHGLRYPDQLPAYSIDYSESIVQVDPSNFSSNNCTPVAAGPTSCPAGSQTIVWIPEYQAEHYTEDNDLGISRVVLFPNPKLGTTAAITGSKTGELVIISDVTSGGSPTAIYGVKTSCAFLGAQIFNNFTYWNNSIYTWCERDGLFAVTTNGLLDNALTWGVGADPYLNITTCGGAPPPRGEGTRCAVSDPNNPATTAGQTGAQLAISSTQPTAPTCAADDPQNPMCGIVWAVSGVGPSNLPGFPGYFAAYDAVSLREIRRFYLGADIPAGAEPLGSDAQVGPEGFAWMKFTPPVVANGRVYVTTASGVVLVYGLGYGSAVVRR